MIALLQYFSLLIASADRVVLGFLNPYDPAIVAIYSFATTLATVLMTFPGAVGSIFFPVVSKLAGKDDMASMRDLMAASQRWTLFITLPISVVMIAFSGDMMHVFYGASYDAGGPAMAIFTLGLVFSALTYTQSLALAALRLVKTELAIASVAGTANIILLFVLVPYLGMEGAALSSFVCFFINAALLGHYGEKMLGFKQPKEAYNLLLAALATFAIMLFLKPTGSQALSFLPELIGGGNPYAPKLAYLLSLGIMISITGALFIIIALLLRCFRAEDVELMGKALGRLGVPEPLPTLAKRIAEYGIHK
jgi:O-antigen/teichoic acid export membrane protein